MRPLALLAAGLLLAACSSPTPTPSPTPTLVHSDPTMGSSPRPSPAPSRTPLVDTFDSPLPADVVERLENVLAGYAVDNSLVSISAAVLVPDVGYWQAAAGLAERDNEVAATPDTAYHISAITQTFVAALILRLAEEGYLTLDDPSADHLGPLAGSKSNGATIGQLLGHRSGIDTYFGEVTDDRPWTFEELLNQVGRPPMAPGGPAAYSPTNYLLLGAIAEVVTGGPLGELLHEYLLDRFGLQRTYYTFTDTVDEPFAHGYELVDGTLVDVYDGSGHLPFANETTITRGVGAMASTAPDLARWMHLLCSGEVLSAESQEQMLDFDAFEGHGKGLVRFGVPGSVGQVIGRGGGGFGYGASAYCDEDTGMVLAVLTTGEFPDPTQLLDRFFAAASHTVD